MVFGLILLSVFFAPADTLKLSELYEAAEQNWPVYAQLDKVQEQVDIQLETIRSAWLPQVFLNASATYISDVTEIPFSPPGGSAPSQPHDRYTATLDVHQVLWDGGASKAQSRVANLTGKVDQAKIKSELYGLRGQIKEVYFGILMLDVRLESINLLLKELSERLSAVNVGVDAGLLLRSQADALEAERLRARQQLVELQQLRRSSWRTLELLTGLEIEDATALDPTVTSNSFTRPELLALSAQQDVISARKGLLDVRLRPQLSAFAQGGVGRPGPNIFDDTLTPFYVVGLQFRWQFFNWGTSSREKQLLDITSGSIQSQMAAFRIGQAVQDVAQTERKKSLLEQLTLDEDIIRLRESVASSSAQQLDSGVITASEYVSVLTSAHQAKLQRRIRELEYQKTEATIQLIQYNGE